MQLINPLLPLAVSYCNTHRLASATTDAVLSLARQWRSESITQRTIDVHIERRRAQLKASSFNREMVSFKAVINYAIKVGQLPDNIKVDATPEKAVKNGVLFLTKTDIAKIRQAELPEHLIAERDRFLLQCATGLRASDIARLKAEQLHGGVLTLRLQKTEELVTIPLTETTQELFGKVVASGYARNNQRVPAIREICRLAGITEPWTSTSRVNGQLVDKVGERWQFVGTHTARRSFICNLLAQGVGIEVIMSMTGHQSYDSIKAYIGIADDTKSRALALLDD